MAGWKTNPPGCSSSSCGCEKCIWLAWLSGPGLGTDITKRPPVLGTPPTVTSPGNTYVTSVTTVGMTFANTDLGVLYATLVSTTNFTGISLYKDAARTELVAVAETNTGSFNGNLAIEERNDSGLVGGTITLANVVSTSLNIEFRVIRFVSGTQDLSTGSGGNGERTGTDKLTAIGRSRRKRTWESESTPGNSAFWFLGPGGKLKSSRGSGFINRGQVMVTVELPESWLIAHDFSGYGQQRATDYIRVFFESDANEQNYWFADLFLEDIGWDSNGSRAVNSSDPSIETNRLFGRSLILTLGKRTDGTDTTYSECIVGHYSNSSDFFNLENFRIVTIALSRNTCESDSSDAPFCFDGYSAVRLTNAEGPRNDAYFQFCPTNPVRGDAVVTTSSDNRGNFDIGASYSTELSTPAGTYFGVVRLPVSGDSYGISADSEDIEIGVRQIWHGEYKKGYLNPFNKDGDTVEGEYITFSRPVHATGPGAEYVDTAKAFGYFDNSVITDIDEVNEIGKLYGRFIDSGLGYSVNVYEDAARTILLGSNAIGSTSNGSVPLLVQEGEYTASIGAAISPPGSDPIDFELEFTMYRQANNKCMAWPQPVTTVCNPKRLITAKLAVAGSGNSVEQDPRANFSNTAVITQWTPGFLGSFQNTFRCDCNKTIYENVMPGAFFGRDIVTQSSYSGVLYCTGLTSRSSGPFDANYIDVQANLRPFVALGFFGPEISGTLPLQSPGMSKDLWIPPIPGQEGYAIFLFDFVEWWRCNQFRTGPLESFGGGAWVTYHRWYAAVPLEGAPLNCNGLEIELNAADSLSDGTFYYGFNDSEGSLDSADFDTAISGLVGTHPFASVEGSTYRAQTVTVTFFEE